MSRGRGRTDEKIFVGVARLELSVPGARSLKDRRQALLSLRDRLRHRFDVTFHEVGVQDEATRQVVVLTTAGNEPRLIRSILDQCVAVVHEHPVAVASRVDVDVFRWQASEQDWAARMMTELAAPPEEDSDG